MKILVEEGAIYINAINSLNPSEIKAHLPSFKKQQAF